MVRPVTVLMLSLAMAPSLSANFCRVLLLAAELATERMPDLLTRTIVRPNLSPQEQLDAYYRGISWEDWSDKKENLQLVVASRTVAFKHLGLPVGTTSDELVAKLKSLPITDRQHQQARQHLIAFFNSDHSGRLLSHEFIGRHLGILTSLSIHYGGHGGILFPCPGCETTKFRRIQNSEVSRIAKTRVPQDQVQLENLLNYELILGDLPMLSPFELAEIPLEHKQVWVLMTQISRYGQGPFKTIADAVLNGMSTTGMHSKDLLYSQHSNRFYRLLFVENLSLAEVKIWTEIINKFFIQEDNVGFKKRYRGGIGHAVFAESNHGSHMGEAIEGAVTILNEREKFHGGLSRRFFSEDSITIELDWRHFRGTVDEYVSVQARQYELDHPHLGLNLQ